MLYIDALSLTSNVNEWLANSRHPRILHVFDHACNLIDEHGDVLSVVTSGIGDGPFNLVVGSDISFFRNLTAQTPISIRKDQLNLGDLTIDTAEAKLWNPRPDWESLHAKKDEIFNQLKSLQIASYANSGLDTGFATSAQPDLTTNLESITSKLSYAIANADFSSAKTIASQLAGLGIGLTPAGDDYLMGAIYATWIIKPIKTATNLAREIAESAAPLTTSLSAALLRSAGRGEAGILWHKFFDALLAGEDIELPITKLIAVGETSGADALAGFISTFISYLESEAKLCHS
jgi:hypothetical protein